MKRRISCIFAASVVLSLGSLPVFAHHSFAAEFDVKQPITLKGTVTKVEWTNPHVWIYIDVTNDNGAVEHWQCENGALNVGDKITIEGFRAKNADNTANARQVTLSDGRKVFSGSAEDGGPAKKDG